MSKKVRILSIDGGGIRGLIPAVILADLERRIQDETGNKQAKLADYFDMIAGTSTGGILTCFYLMLSDDKESCRYFAKDAISLYKEHGKTIFKKKINVGALSKILGSLYSHTGLESLLSEKLGTVKLSEIKKSCMITAYDISKRKAVFFTAPLRKKKKEEEEEKDYLLKDIARSTSAAPTYFEPSKIESVDKTTAYLIDGGMFANDPTMCALAEVRKHRFPNCSKPNFEDMYVVSIGTGKVDKSYEYDKARKWGLARWIAPLIDILMSSSAEVVSYQVNKLFEAVKCPLCYVRIEPELKPANPEMDDVSATNISNLEQAGVNYIKGNGEKLDTIARTLIENHHL
jgi:patatin-like phospholipase/acyl hydrolase